MNNKNIQHDKKNIDKHLKELEQLLDSFLSQAVLSNENGINVSNQERIGTLLSLVCRYKEQIKSVRILLRNGQVPDATSIARDSFELYVQIAYILKERELIEEKLKFYREFQLLKSNLEILEIHGDCAESEEKVREDSEDNANDDIKRYLTGSKQKKMILKKSWYEVYEKFKTNKERVTLKDLTKTAFNYDNKKDDELEELWIKSLYLLGYGYASRISHSSLVREKVGINNMSGNIFIDKRPSLENASIPLMLVTLDTLELIKLLSRNNDMILLQKSLLSPELETKIMVNAEKIRSDLEKYKS